MSGVKMFSSSGTGSVCFLVLLAANYLTHFLCASMPSQDRPTGAHQNAYMKATLRDYVDISMNQKPGGRPSVSSNSSNMLWQSSDNATAIYLHTNSSAAGGWGGTLELKRPSGGGTIGIKRPPEGGVPIVSIAGSSNLYESNGTTVGVNGMIDSAGNRETHMSIKRP